MKALLDLGHALAPEQLANLVRLVEAAVASHDRTRFGRSASRRLPAAGRAPVRPAEQRERRPQEDEQIGLPAAMADVPEVELDPLGPREPGAAVDLGPTGDARLHVEPVQLPLVVLLALVAERRAGDAVR